MSRRRDRRIFLASLLATLLLGATTPSPGASSWYPIAGAVWYSPLDSSVRELYGTGLGLGAGLGYQISPRFGAEFALGWFHATGRPEASLVPSAGSTLTCLPFYAEFLWRPFRLAHPRGTLSPRLSAGPALVFSREELRYQAFGERSVLRGKRSDAGGTGAVALEWQARRWRAALCGRAVLTGGHREVLRADGGTDERSARATPSLRSLGVELRIPLR